MKIKKFGSWNKLGLKLFLSKIKIIGNNIPIIDKVWIKNCAIISFPFILNLNNRKRKINSPNKK
jgi:hypothetical protein